MSQIISLTVYTRNSVTPASSTLGFDIADFITPIRFDTGASKSYFSSRMLRDIKNNGRSENNARVDYVVNESLTTITAKSEKLLKLTVDSIDDKPVTVAGVPITSEDMIFFSERILEALVPGASGGTYFFYHEEGYPLPRKYHVTQSVSQIVTAATPPVPLPGIPTYGVVRAVYLVNDAADVTALGGATNNVYSTFQAAYTAANTLATALTAIVPIIIGNTTAAAVGDVTLTANWNPNVQLTGINKNDSIVGNIIGGAFTVSLTASHVRVGNITTDSQAIGLTLRNALVGNIDASSTTTASGAISISNSYDVTIGTITSNASSGNTAGVTFTSCNDITTGAISTINTATSGNYSITALSLTSCNNVVMAGYTATMNQVNSTGVVGGIICLITNTNIIFSAPVIIQGFTNTLGTPSDVQVSQINIQNVTFNSNFCVNGRNAAGDTPTGGWVVSTIIENCAFNGSRNKLFFNTANPKTVSNYFIRNCRFTAGGFNNFIYNVSFADMEAVGIYVKDTSIGFGINASTSPVALSTGANTFTFRNFTGQGVFYFQFIGNAATIDTLNVEDMKLTQIEYSIYGGDGNMHIKSCSFDMCVILDNAGFQARRHVFINCHGLLVTGGPSIVDCYQSNLECNDATTPNINAYGSTLNFYGSGAATISGALYTSTITRQNTSTLSATNNNSFDNSLP